MSNPKKNSKAKVILGKKGEEEVAEQLRKRGFYCQLWPARNHKGTDLVVEHGDNFFRVSVKSKIAKKWPNVKGITRKGDLLVFVDYEGRKSTESPDFYVLGVKDFARVVKKIIKRRTDGAVYDKKTNSMTYLDGSWTGCVTSVEDVVKYKNRWPKK